MPSRAEIRGGIETALRVVSVAVLAWMLWLSLDRGRPEIVVSGRSANMNGSLREWSAAGIAPDRVVAQLDSTPSEIDRDWLRALRSSGSSVSWSGDLAPVALNAQAIASPRGGWTVTAAAPTGSKIAVSDEVGPLDTAVAASGGARYSIPSASGMLSARVGGSIASASLDDSVRIKRVLVLGSAGWETKFVVAALEEDGWKVDSDMHIAPGVDVSQGSLSPIDTSRYSAVIALDAMAALRASEINRYVSSGGGLILAGSSASLDAFAALRAGATSRAITPSVLESEPGSVDLNALAFVPIAGLRGDAIALERRNGNITAAARRHGAGRVLQEGYLETWRWRMSGGDTSPAEHRVWWTRSVASVAYAPHSRIATSAKPDNAPVARLVAAIGPSSSAQPASLSSASGSISLWVLFAILSFSLLGEWASRRLRGSR
ncbi:MAG TPA: hypothetical protein VKO87_09255 [Gemmatimonadaceae bacterium]|nr:hypothetical protein [Gemmatimonadaceae bacterium]